MVPKKVLEEFENSTVHSLIDSKETRLIEWNEHSSFKGVFLKHLIRSAETDGKLSYHLVKVNAGCILDTHVHNGKTELHQVLKGKGECIIGNRTVEYNPGTVSLIPADTDHKVKAGDEGIFLLAVFSPALI